MNDLSDKIEKVSFQDVKPYSVALVYLPEGVSVNEKTVRDGLEVLSRDAKCTVVVVPHGWKFEFVEEKALSALIKIEQSLLSDRDRRKGYEPNYWEEELDMINDAIGLKFP